MPNGPIVLTNYCSYLACTSKATEAFRHLLILIGNRRMHLCTTLKTNVHNKRLKTAPSGVA